jgi:hypothetical protein
METAVGLCDMSRFAPPVLGPKLNPDSQRSAFVSAPSCEHRSEPAPSRERCCAKEVTLDMESRQLRARRRVFALLLLHASCHGPANGQLTRAK